MTLNLVLLITLFVSMSCAKKPTEESTSTRALYVSSGVCYSGGGNTTYNSTTASNIIYKVDLDTGVPGEILADFGNSPTTTGNTPVSILNNADGTLSALVENTGGRRIYAVPKTKGNLTLLDGNYPAGLNAVVHMLARAIDGNFLVSATSKVEKISTTGARMYVSGTTSYILGSSLAGNCANSTKNISGLTTTNTGKIIYAHAYLNQNHVSVVSSTGYASGSDCLSGVNAPVTNAYPTSVIYLSNFNKVLILYAGTAAVAEQNSIYAYDFDESTGALSNETQAFQDTNVIYGGSAMAFDDQTGRVYIATANTAATTISNYNIEEFSFDPTSNKLTRVGSTPFSSGWLGSHCISSMFVGD